MVYFVILGIIFFTLSYWFYKESISYRVQKGIKGPWYPNLPAMGQSYILSINPFEQIKKLSKKYGPVYSFNIGPFPTIIITTKDLMNKTFADDNLLGRPYNILSSFFTMMKGGGIDGAIPGFAGSQGRNWKEQRQFVEAELNKHNGEKVNGIIVEETQSFIKIFLEKFQNKKQLEINMSSFFMPITINVVWSLCTGQQLPYNDPKIVDIVEKIQRFFFFLSPGPSMYVQLRYPIAMKIAKFFGFTNGMNTYMDLGELISQELDNSIYNDMKENKFVQRYYGQEKARNRRSSFFGHTGRVNLVATLNDLFTGGSDTTNNQLCWVFLHLAYYQELQHQIRVEIIDAFESDELFNIDQCQKTPLTMSFILEILRIRPIAPLALPRMATSDCEVENIKFKKNTQLIVDLSSFLNDENLFKDPHIFNPRRFLKDNGEVDVDNIYISKVFGAGKRRCPGSKIAKNELYIITAMFTKYFRIKPSPSNQGFDKLFKGDFGLNHVPKYHNLIIEKIEQNLNEE